MSRYLDETTAHPAVAPTSVLVGAGVKQALFNCCYSLFSPGDEVIIPAPFWPSYTAIVELAGATPVLVETTWEDGFVADVDRLEAARTERTRGLFLNSPSNPTGAVWDLDTLSGILEWADRHGIWVLSDEIYRRLSYGDAAPSVYDVPQTPERVVLLDGVSKAFCMPGLRIGFAVGPTELIKKASDLQGQTTSGAVGPSQVAAAAALGRTEEREAFVRDLVGKLTGLRRQGLEGFEGIEALDVRPPAGSIYFYARLRDGSRSSMEVGGGPAEGPGRGERARRAVRFAGLPAVQLRGRARDPVGGSPSNRGVLRRLSARAGSEGTAPRPRTGRTRMRRGSGAPLHSRA